MKDFDACSQKWTQRVEKFLEKLLPIPITPLHNALRYSVLNGGKRLRPQLVYATGEALGHAIDLLDPAAASVELIHCYSLVHDDLPAMDDDDFRRGKPSCHKAFDEATAILTGDALQALAFQTLSDPELTPVHPKNKIAMLQILAKQSGVEGMILGQAMDMSAMNNPSVSFETLCAIHQKKTGALIEASVSLGALASTHEVDQSTLSHLQEYSRCIGLSFQIQDDILDVIGITKTLGKTAGKDKQQNKSTFPSQFGLEGSKKKALELHKQALESIAPFGNKGLRLAKLSERFITRIQ